MTGAPTRRVCVIGAGPSGLAALKVLAEAGLEPDGFEQDADVGGNWLYSGEAGHSSVFESTHIISSKRFSQYQDHAMPEDWPDYPSRKLLIEYFRGYARRFDLQRRIRFGTRVERIEPAGSAWRVVAAMGVLEYDHVVVANGHHWSPRLPEWPGTYAGRLLHSHDFKTAAPFAGQRVMIVGGGNSACDCAVEVSRVAERTVISMRRGTWFMPKLILGFPNDVVYSWLLPLPPRLRQVLVRILLRVYVGPFEAYGLQRPDHGPLECHPTLNSELLERLRHGDIAPRSGIARFEGRFAHFEDGPSEEFDAVIACTGYRVSFPFLSREVADFGDAAPPLYLRVFHPDRPGLHFVGLVQPLGCIWPLAELQSHLVADVITGRARLPRDLRGEALRDIHNPPFRFLPTPRHALEVDFHFHQYAKQLRQARRRLAA